MKPARPDLNVLSPDVCAYIEALEEEIESLRATKKPPKGKAEEESFENIYESFEPAEPPTTINLITVTASGLAKRTPRHLYNRQRRGGMGVFDIETSENDPPQHITLADKSQSLLLITNFARAFRKSVSAIPEMPVHARGVPILDKLSLQPGECIASVLPDQAHGYIALLSERGMVRHLRHHVFGEYMKPGASLYDYPAFGPLVAACWTPGDGELFVATRQGRAIRFSEKLITPQGTLAIRLVKGDAPVGICTVYPQSGVFLLGIDGKGTIRSMPGFAPNKAPGGGGKNAINTDHLLSVLNADECEDVFVISKLSKLIRFRVDEIPPKEGIVQGVICMSLRADEPVAAVLSQKFRMI